MLSRCLRVLIFTSFSFEYYLTSFFSLLDCLFRLWLFGGWQLCVWISVRMCTCMRTDTCMCVNVKRNFKNNGHIFNARFKSIKVRSKRETSHSPPPSSPAEARAPAPHRSGLPTWSPASHPIPPKVVIPVFVFQPRGIHSWEFLPVRVTTPSGQHQSG